MDVLLMEGGNIYIVNTTRLRRGGKNPDRLIKERSRCLKQL
jgi:hypothetical protein